MKNMSSLIGIEPVSSKEVISIFSIGFRWHLATDGQPDSLLAPCLGLYYRHAPRAIFQRLYKKVLDLNWCFVPEKSYSNKIFLNLGSPVWIIILKLNSKRTIRNYAPLDTIFNACKATKITFEKSLLKLLQFRII